MRRPLKRVLMTFQINAGTTESNAFHLEPQTLLQATIALAFYSATRA